MKILQVCLKPPAPPVDGGTRAMYQLSELLYLCGFEVKVVAANTDKHFVKKENIPAEFYQKFTPEYFYLNTNINPLSAFINLLGNKSYHASRFFSIRFLSHLSETIQKDKFDVVIFDSVIMAVYLPFLKNKFPIKYFIRSHNIENEIWSLIGLETKFFLKRWYLNLQAKRLKEFEEKMYENANGVISINNPDTEYIKKFNRKTITIPFTVDKPKSDSTSGKQKEIFRIYHVASMDWIPNVEGMMWFYNEVWNEYFKHHKHFELTIAGRKMPSEFFKFTGENVNVYGEINDVEKFIKDFDVMICPLFAGSGIRIKIVEALKASKVVISTTLGASGIPFQNYQPSPVIIANTAKEFSEAIQQLSKEDLWERKKNAVKLIEEHFTPQSFVSVISTFLNGS